MLFGYFTLVVAIMISAISAYYSVLGLTTIFVASFWPIVIMGGALEIGKITASLWLKLHWKQSSLSFKLYLIPSIIVLMFLTSMGIFGGLSKAHSDQSVITGDGMSKVAMFDDKIKVSTENIEANRKALKQLDEAVDQVMSRSTSESGAVKAVTIRKSQAPDRRRLIAEIAEEQKTISQLTAEKAPFANELRKLESETGPIKYIAALVYGDNPSVNLMERSVRWIIILIVLVFDPLALVLMLAAQQSIQWNAKAAVHRTEFSKSKDDMILVNPINTMSTNEPKVAKVSIKLPKSKDMSKSTTKIKKERTKKITPVPDLKIPETQTEAILPDLNLPEVNLPVAMPTKEAEATLPDFSLPDFKLPELTLPEEMQTKEAADEVTLPDFSLPDFKLPELTLPEPLPSKWVLLDPTKDEVPVASISSSELDKKLTDNLNTLADTTVDEDSSPVKKLVAQDTQTTVTKNPKRKNSWFPERKK